MRKGVLYILGGVIPSGAETRISKTAQMHADREVGVAIVLRQSLLERLESKGLALSDNIIVYKLVDMYCGRASKVRYLASLLFTIIRLIYLSALGRFSSVHVSLFKPHLFLVLLPFVQQFFFEVTSPDVVVTLRRARILNLGLKSIPLFKKIVFIAVSESVGDRMKREVPHVLLEGDRLRVRHQPFSMASVKRVENKKNTVIYAHRLIERKSPLLAVSSFVRLGARFPHWEFLVFGGGELESKVSKMLDEASLDNVVYKGRVDNLSEYLESSKVFVSLIRPDNYPSQSILEAMALGNALCISNTGVSVAKFLDGNGAACSLTLESVVSQLSVMLESFDSKWMEASQRLVDSRYSLAEYLNEHMLCMKRCEGAG